MNLRTLLSTLFTACVFSYATADNSITNAWNQSLSVSGTTTSPKDIIKGVDGSFFSFANYTSKGSESDITFFGYDLPTTSNFGGTTANHNIVLVKHNIAGVAEWAVYSNGGYVDASYSAIAPTSDRGVLMMLKVRRADKNDSDETKTLIKVTSSDGSSKSLTFDYQQESGKESYAWVYQPVIVKVDGNGKIEAIKRCYADLSQYNDVFYFNGATTDADNNIYVVGRISGDLTVDGVTIPHHNTEDWDGDTQKTRGNAFILKFDSDLNLVAHAETSGVNNYDDFQNITYVNGTLLTSGLLKSEGGNFSFGGKSISAGAAGSQSIWVSAINPNNLTATNMYLLEGFVSNTKNIIQLKNITVSADKSNAFIMGSLNGGITIGEKTLVSGGNKQLKGFFIKINAADASLIDGLCLENKTIGAVYSVIDNGDSLFVFGYDMGRTTTSVPLFESYNRTTLEKVTEYNLFSGTAATTTTWPCMAVSGDSIIVSLRGKTVITPYGSTDSYGSTSDFYSLESCFVFEGYNFSGNTTPTEATEEESVSELTVYGANGVLYVSGSEGTVKVMDLTGRTVAEITEGGHSVAIKSGLYIICDNKESKKIKL